MRLLVTGSREWADDAKMHDHLLTAAVEAGGYMEGPDPITLIHGGCPRGADAMADVMAQVFGWLIEVHLADWRMGKQAGHWRNQHMVNLGADLCLAFFVHGAANRGTSDCVARANEAGIPIIEIWTQP